MNITEKEFTYENAAEWKKEMSSDPKRWKLWRAGN